METGVIRRLAAAAPFSLQAGGKRARATRRRGILLF
jgi:hypothetical protein